MERPGLRAAGKAGRWLRAPTRSPSAAAKPGAHWRAAFHGGPVRGRPAARRALAGDSRDASRSMQRCRPLSPCEPDSTPHAVASAISGATSSVPQDDLQGRRGHVRGRRKQMWDSRLPLGNECPRPFRKNLVEHGPARTRSEGFRDERIRCPTPAGRVLQHWRSSPGSKAARRLARPGATIPGSTQRGSGTGSSRMAWIKAARSKC